MADLGRDAKKPLGLVNKPVACRQRLFFRDATWLGFRRADTLWSFCHVVFRFGGTVFLTRSTSPCENDGQDNEHHGQDADNQDGFLCRRLLTGERELVLCA
jgi:hypothetical protein